MATNRNNMGQIARKKWFFKSLSGKVNNPITEAYSEPYQTSKMVLIAKIVNDFQPLAISTKNILLGL